ncbi:MAG: hypothetical protein ACRCV9_12200 [Burkholderiaceae bacterium]
MDRLAANLGIFESALRNIHAGFGAKMAQKAHEYCVVMFKKGLGKQI